MAKKYPQFYKHLKRLSQQKELIPRLTVVLGAITLSLILILTIILSQTPVIAHRPHDVVTTIKASHHYQDNQTLYIVVRGNFFRSSNGGLSWQRLVKGLETDENISDIEIIPSNSSDQETILASSEGDGIYRSTDQGNSWTTINQGLKNLNILLLEASPKLALASDQQGNIYKTTDLGNTWTSTLTITDDQIISLEILAANNNFVVVGTRKGKLWISQDSGNSWVPYSLAQNLIASEQILTLEIYSKQEKQESQPIILIGTNTGKVLESINGGKDWQTLGQTIIGESILDLEVSSRENQTPSLFLSTSTRGFFVFNQNTWQPYTKGLKTDEQAKEMKAPNFGDLEIAPDGKTVFLAGFDGLFKTEDWGNNWQNLDTLLRNTIVALAVSPNYENDSTIALASYVGQVYLSNVRGATWKIVNKGLEVPLFTRDFIEVDPNYDPRRFFDINFSPTYQSDRTIIASTLWTKIAKTTNGGESWDLVPMPKEIRGLTFAISPNFSKDKTIYVAGQDKNIYQSTNGGKKFTVIGERPMFKGNYGPYLVISPNFVNDRTLYASGKEGVYKSEDAGKTWQAVTAATAIAQQGKLQIVLSPNYTQDQTVLVGTNRGLFISKDAGRNWRQINTIIPEKTELYVEAVAISPNYEQDQTFIVSIRGYGLFKTTDNGQTFKAIADPTIPFATMGYVPSSGRPLVFSPAYAKDKTIYGFGSATHQIYRSQNGGETWETIDIPPLTEAKLSVFRKAEITTFVYIGLIKKILALAIILGIISWGIVYLKSRHLISVISAQVQSIPAQKIDTSVGLKAIVCVIIAIKIYCSFMHLDAKIYNADEVRGLYRIGGYTRQEVVAQLFTGQIIDKKDLQYFQLPPSYQGVGETVFALSQNSEHTPLYYLVVRFWMQIFGSPYWGRVLSVLFGLMAMLGVFWLSKEIFQSPVTAWISVALVGISPYQILLSQGLREYSLWLLAITLANASLLRALRVNSRSSWIIYAITLVVGFYSHLFFVFTALCHGIYVFLVVFQKNRRQLLSFLWTLTAAISVFMPWLIVILTSIEEIEEKTQWVKTRKSNFSIMVQSFISQIGNQFLDLDEKGGKGQSYFNYLMVILLGLSIYCLIRFTPKKVWLFVLLPIIIVPITLAVPDLLFGGGRSLQTRYLLPSGLFVQLAIAQFIAHSIHFSLHKWEQYFWKAVFAGLLMAGIGSGWVILNSPAWDYLDQGQTANAANLQVAPMINQSQKPLVISDTTHSFLLGLSYLVKDDTDFKLFNREIDPTWVKQVDFAQEKNNYSDVFIYFPDQKTIKTMEDSGLVLKSLDRKRMLYQIEEIGEKS